MCPMVFDNVTDEQFLLETLFAEIRNNEDTTNI